ncbi:MAG: preprotein translocase subunit SecA [[Candidatus Thermochlorobacteriaceae] bacterium GBChlB]|nr:MAG: preprotein translocase subunit SecA [[Candidatus Thermochlorobacteriaceae] bacterium GBChlB]
MLKFIEKIFGSKHDKDIKRIRPIVDEINAYAEEYKALSDADLRAKTNELKTRVREHLADIDAALAEEQEKLKNLDLTFEEVQAIKEDIERLEKERHEASEEILNEILPEAFAIVKDTCRRLVGKKWIAAGNEITWDMIPYDVQLIGGVVLHEGKIAEMATGEGKTLVATLPTFLNALTGKGVHIVTVNDYLARRDKEWMAPIFEFHGLKVGVILSEMDSSERREQYAADITFGTNNEFGFDYLRDNMATDKEEVVQRGFNFAIVDEVDSVLIDEARTPLIISGPVPQSNTDKFAEMKPRVERLVRAQQNLVAKFLSEAERLMAEGEKADKDWEFKAGLALLRAKRGQPKNKRYLKLIGEAGNARLMQAVENEFLRDNARRMHEVDDELYFSIDERFHNIDLTEKGRELITDSNQDKDFFVLPDVGTEIAKIQSDPSLNDAQKQEKKDELYRLFSERSERIHNVSQLLRAYSLYEKDDEYVVQDGKVLIVDEFTGRILSGRRYSDGLHQAIEAKEGVKIEGETQTMATITLQNYFRLYKKLAGMTGTAETEASEFFEIYKLDVVVIPTNRPPVRQDREDLVFKTKREKYNAAIKKIEELRQTGQPVLVGTTSVEVSETLSRMLKMKKIPHNVLNAKQHQREAEIVAQAGQKGAVTIATNMAGRGTDIKLGLGVKELGGLYILGTERHEARRIDRQLRGRAGRQGDPGTTEFFVSLEDDLMRLFGSERIASVMDRLGHQEGDIIQHPMVTKSIERAQRRVEEQNFATRKRLLEYDNVMNQQREIIYARRRNALFKDRLRIEIFDLLHDYAEQVAAKFAEEFDADNLKEQTLRELSIDLPLTSTEYQRLGKEGVADLIYQTAAEFYKRKEEHLGSEMMGRIEKFAVLNVIDEKWREHLRDIDDVKEGINLRAYGQKDPLLEYKQEAFKLFVEMLESIAADTLSLAFKLYPTEQKSEQVQPRRIKKERLVATHSQAKSVYSGAPQNGSDVETAEEEPTVKQQPIRVEKAPGRNDPCFCGSGKKYKNCHGKAQL